MIIIKTLPPYDSLDSSLKQANLLPPKDPSAPPYTLVLDLDETLVHCVMEPVEVYDTTFDVVVCPSFNSRSQQRDRDSVRPSPTLFARVLEGNRVLVRNRRVYRVPELLC